MMSGKHTERSLEKKKDSSRSSSALIRFLKKPLAQKRLLAEALLWVGVFRFVICFLPFSVFKMMIGEPGPGEAAHPDSDHDIPGPGEAAHRESDHVIPGPGETAHRDDDHDIPGPAETAHRDGNRDILYPGETAHRESGHDNPRPDASDPNFFDGTGGTDSFSFSRTSDLPADSDGEFVVHNIARAVALVSRRVPWDSKCLVKAAAAKTMMRRRRISATLYLGVRRDYLLQGNMKPHAWLTVNSQVAIGGGELQNYVVVSKFS